MIKNKYDKLHDDIIKELRKFSEKDMHKMSTGVQRIYAFRISQMVVEFLQEAMDYKEAKDEKNKKA